MENLAQPATFTISSGRNITSAADALTRVSLPELAAIVADTSSDLARQVSTLRQVIPIDPSRYRDMKRALPYIVCAAFSPAFRKGENFAFADCFIIDIDHIADNGLSLPDLRARLQADPRVALLFASPSADGLKVLFRLSERCFDKGSYSIFYKLFAADFAQKYDIQSAVDTRTSDVTRACFLSADPQVYVNQSAEPVSIADYVNLDDPFAFIQQQEALRDKERQQAQQQPADPRPADPTADAMALIRSKLAANAKPKPMPPAPFVPKQLEELMPKLKAYVTDSYGLDIYEVIDIQYGKKVRARVGNAMAEVNIFFGKRGFRPVISPRGGTNPELNKSLFQMAECFLADYQQSA